jgi:uncharacterized membrane protein
MLTIYLVLKFVHVLSAIVAIGTNVTYGVWIARASRESAALPFALRGVKLLDDRIANPAYVVLLLTGFAMTGVSDMPITTPWILVSLVLFVLTFVIGLFGYTPTLRRQIAALDRGGAASPEYQALARHGSRMGGVLAVLVLAIVFLMVVKPSLWQ